MLYSNLLLPLLVTPALAAHVPRNPKRSHGHVDLSARSGDVLIEARGPAPELRKPKAKRVVKKKRAEGSLCLVPGTNTTSMIGGGAWASGTPTASASASVSVSATASPSASPSAGGGGSSTSWSLDEAWVSLPLFCSQTRRADQTARKQLFRPFRLLGMGRPYTRYRPVPGRWRCMGPGPDIDQQQG